MAGDGVDGEEDWGEVVLSDDSSFYGLSVSKAIAPSIKSIQGMMT